jgi:hypothetical protein
MAEINWGFVPPSNEIVRSAIESVQETIGKDPIVVSMSPKLYDSCKDIFNSPSDSYIHLETYGDPESNEYRMRVAFPFKMVIHYEL